MSQDVTARSSPLSTGGSADPFFAHLQPLLAEAEDVAIVAAFTMDSGLRALRDPLWCALRSGARVRILTSDYMDLTEPKALRRLRDWMRQCAAMEPEDPGREPILEARVVSVAELGRGFHPKSWRFSSRERATAFVGSSNLSEAALRKTVEWNLRVEREHDPQAYQQVVAAFEALWGAGQPLTGAWIAAYEGRRRKLPEWVHEEPPAPPPPVPHQIQEAALAALAAVRARGLDRAVVVLATGLGKTLLAAFDILALMKGAQRPPRILLLAHRRELLTQGGGALLLVLREAWPALESSWYADRAEDLSGDVVLGSVLKLAGPRHLERLGRERFDYVIVDEVHHVAATSYRVVLDRLQAGFRLGLTATPERADQQDIGHYFGYNFAYRAGLREGIALGRLVPFAYHGVPDGVDYQSMTFRGGEFLDRELAERLSTSERMTRLWTVWQAQPGRQTLVFCCNVEHARFVTGWLRERGVRARAVHSKPDSYDRETALRELSEGQLDALCTVDLFNEGVDVPTVDRVVLLRPTGSSVVFLQQLGRGLRSAVGKARLVVIDFVGNHRIFAARLRTVLALLPGAPSAREVVQQRRAMALPEGCLVDIPVEALDVLGRLLGDGESTPPGQVFRELWEQWERRPTPLELWHRQVNPRVLALKQGSWPEFLETQVDALTEEERGVVAAARAWFKDLERPVSEVFPLVAAQVLAESGALLRGMEEQELAAQGLAFIQRDPELAQVLAGRADLPTPVSAVHNSWRALWQRAALDGWAGGAALLRRSEGRVAAALSLAPDQEEVLATLAREVMEWRIAEHLARGKTAVTAEELRCKVSWNKRDPIISLAGKRRIADFPQETGRLLVTTPEGELWVMECVAQYINVARPYAKLDGRNALASLLRGWFGADAGTPGTDHWVVFARTALGWTLRPQLRGDAVASAALRTRAPRPQRVRAYPSLRVAAGPALDPREEEPPVEQIELSLATEVSADVFAVRATGDSMDGGELPIHDGDWLVLRRLLGVNLAAAREQVALVATSDALGGYTCQVKRVRQRDGRWCLCSDNPDYESQEVAAEARCLAILVEVAGAGRAPHAD